MGGCRCDRGRPQYSQCLRLARALCSWCVGGWWLRWLLFPCLQPHGHSNHTLSKCNAGDDEGRNAESLTRDQHEGMKLTHVQQICLQALLSLSLSLSTTSAVLTAATRISSSLLFARGLDFSPPEKKCPMLPRERCLRWPDFLSAALAASFSPAASTVLPC